MILKTYSMIKAFSFLLLSLSVLSCNQPGEPYKDGKALYNNLCAGCHGIKLEGFASLYPSLDNSRRIKVIRKALPCIISNGINHHSSRLDSTLVSMPGFPQLNDIDLSNLLNYLNSNYWQLENFDLDEINQLLTKCPKN